MGCLLQNRRTWKRAIVKKPTHFIKENTDQIIERIAHNEKTALQITYKNNISLKDLSFLKKTTTYLGKENLPFSTLLSYDHTKTGYRGVWTLCEGRVKGNWTEKEYALFGTFLGKMHKAAGKYKEKTLLRPPIIFSLRERFELIKEYLPATFDTIEALLLTIEQKWPLYLPTGLVHTDLFPSNILFKQSGVSGILQNHNMQIDILLYDLTSVIKSLYFSNTDSLEKKEVAFFKNYTDICPLSEEEVRALPVLTAAKLLLNTITLLEKHFHTSEFKDMHLNSAAITLVHAENALLLYK